MNNEIFDYKKLNLQSCDILICSGNGRLSKLIQKFQSIVGFKPAAKEMSHITCVIRLTYQQLIDLRKLIDEWIDSDPDDLYVLESTTINEWCDKKGVQVNPLSEWLDNYDGKVYVRKLSTPLIKEDISGFIVSHINDEYENGIAGFFELLFCGLILSRYIRSVFPNWKPRATKTPHCSELIAKLLKSLKLLKDITIENRMPPAVWWNQLQTGRMHLEHATLDENILVSIGEPIRIK